MDPSELPSGVQALLRRHGLLQELIVRCVRSEMVDSIVLTEDEINVARLTLAGQHGLELEELSAHFQAQGVEIDEAIWQLTLPQRVRRYSQSQFYPKVEARFLERKADLDCVVYSLLRVKDLGLANELFLRISGCEASFGDLATQFSEGHEKTTRGIIGPVPVTKAHPQLGELLRTAKPGEVMPPTPIEGWYLIVRLESYIPAVLDDSMRMQMELEIFEAHVQQKASAVLATFLSPGSTAPPTPDA